MDKRVSLKNELFTLYFHNKTYEFASLSCTELRELVYNSGMIASTMMINDVDISDSWMVQLLRISAFPIAGVPVADPTSWWETTIGSAPDSMTNKPKEGLVQLNGQIDETAQLVLSCQPDRIDWQLSPIEPTDLPPDYPAIDNFETALPKFIDIINRWLEQPRPEFQRIAFGAILVKQVSNRVSGYSEIAKYLPAVKIDAEGSTDFSYTINRPRPSTLAIEGLTINRLSKWGVAVFKMFKLPMIASEGIKLIMHAADKETYLCRLELDINTTTDIAKLPNEQIKEIFAELVNLAKEIAAQGDVN